MFLLDTSDSKPTHVELSCLKLHQPGCSGYIESIPDNLDPDITVFPIHDIIAMYHMPTVVTGSSRIIIRLNSYFNWLKRLIGNHFLRQFTLSVQKSFIRFFIKKILSLSISL